MGPAEENDPRVERERPGMKVRGADDKNKRVVQMRQPGSGFEPVERKKMVRVGGAQDRVGTAWLR